MFWFLGAVWLLIMAKCGLIWWAMLRWHVPFHPGWLVGPTLLFAALATVIWLAADDE
ncbi:MAG TPA: hypothetical protein VG734_05680 [Lacunisphaera sp.]|nr:hypothetical protein [Lacunisphaera sp.]